MNVDHVHEYSNTATAPALDFPDTQNHCHKITLDRHLSRQARSLVALIVTTLLADWDLGSPEPVPMPDGRGIPPLVVMLVLTDRFSIPASFGTKAGTAILSGRRTLPPVSRVGAIGSSSCLLEVERERPSRLLVDAERTDEVDLLRAEAADPERGRRPDCLFLDTGGSRPETDVESDWAVAERGIERESELVEAEFGRSPGRATVLGRERVRSRDGAGTALVEAGCEEVAAA